MFFRNGNGSFPINFAAEKGRLEVVKLLVTAGANVNIANMYEPHPTALSPPFIPNASRHRHGCSPLHFAAINGHLEVAQQLMNAGADTNMKERCVPIWLPNMPY